MIAPIQKISDTLCLVAPDVGRDVPLSLVWMNGKNGHETQRLMGIPPREIHDHTLVEEQELIKSFIETSDEIVWMISNNGVSVGAIEIHLQSNDYIDAPSVHIMIGDISARGKGIGPQCMQRAVGYLASLGHNRLYSRYLTLNTASAHMCKRLGFKLDGETYRDEDGLEWQNVVLEKRSSV